MTLGRDIIAFFHTFVTKFRSPRSREFLLQSLDLFDKPL